MTTDLTTRLGLLSKQPKSELVALWRNIFSTSPPINVRRGLLVRVLARKIQEAEYGGLKADTRKRLRELARRFAANPGVEILGGCRIKPGTRLIRQWRGRPHQVTVLEGGFEYAGRKYLSLSEIARAITGTRWSGPLFFGLKGKQAKRRQADAQ